MRSFTFMPVLALPLGLAACANTDLDQLQQAQTSGPTFQQALAENYEGLSQFEKKEYDWETSETWAEKGLAAASGQNVQPVDPAEWVDPGGYNVVAGTTVTQQEYQELVQARQALTAALDAETTARSPANAAVAQVSYDCWVEQVQEGHQPLDILACRESFLTAMAALQQPVQTGMVLPTDRFLVYFEFDEAEITPEAQQIIDQVAETIQRRDEEVLIVGHADRAGPADYNRNLSQRRALAMAEALVDAGVPQHQIALAAEGETEPLVPTPDGVPLPQNRRAAIQF